MGGVCIWIGRTCTVTVPASDVQELKEVLEAEKMSRQLWQTSCEQVRKLEEPMATKDREIES